MRFAGDSNCRQSSPPNPSVTQSHLQGEWVVPVGKVAREVTSPHRDRNQTDLHAKREAQREKMPL